MNEFELIKKYFQNKTKNDPQVVVGIGDDSAILKIPQNEQLVVCVDTIVNGIHFLPNTPAAAVGHRALAVNLSDMAAMGAQPAWFTLALTLPDANEEWVAEFSQGLFDLANQHHVTLIGGDTTQGPLSVTIQVLGLLPDGKGLLRSAAKEGDKIFVTGCLGDAGVGLGMLQNKISVPADHREYFQHRYEYPEPRVSLGLLLREVANSAIDVSDGLVADLGHILEASHVGARIYADQIPLSHAMKKSVSTENALYLALTSGDDYEICFTASADRHSDIAKMTEKTGIACTCIGEIVSGNALNIQDMNGKIINFKHQGWEHFL
jgi:thiamine-monophosphate kinase